MIPLNPGYHSWPLRDLPLLFMPLSEVYIDRQLLAIGETLDWSLQYSSHHLERLISTVSLWEGQLASCLDSIHVGIDVTAYPVPP